VSPTHPKGGAKSLEADGQLPASTGFAIGPLERGTYAAAIDPATREVVELAIAPHGLVLDFAATIDA
jgi:hypothetical protein